MMLMGLWKLNSDIAVAVTRDASLPNRPWKSTELVPLDVAPSSLIEVWFFGAGTPRISGCCSRCWTVESAVSSVKRS